MSILSVASMICEEICLQPQQLLNNYVASVGIIKFEEFHRYCASYRIVITEDMFEEMLANNSNYLFTESEYGWIPTQLDELDQAVEMLLTEEDDFFGYDAIAKPMWQDKFKEATEEFGVCFDLENDNDISDRVISLPQRLTLPEKCVFHCQMRKGGGDWEQPSIYFRCQLWDGYAFGHNSNPYFCFIPNHDQGNYHLIKHEDIWGSPDSNSKIEEEPDEKECWAALEDYLLELIDEEVKEHEKNDSDVEESGEKR